NKLSKLSSKLSIAAVLGCAALQLLSGGVAPGFVPAAGPHRPVPIVHASAPIAQGTSAEPAQFFARRSRGKQEIPSTTQQDQSGSPTAEAALPATPLWPKLSSASQPEPGTVPIVPTGSDAWSDAQVIAALRECVRLLGPIAAEVEISEPLKRE